MKRKKQQKKSKRKTRGNTSTRSRARTVGVMSEDRYKASERKMFTFDTNAGLYPIKVQNALRQMRDAQ